VAQTRKTEKQATLARFKQHAAAAMANLPKILQQD